MVNCYEVLVQFQYNEQQLSENILYHFLHSSFLWNIYLIEKYLFSTQNHWLEAFTTLPKHKNYLHLNIQDVVILYFYHNHSCICCWLLDIIEWHIPPLKPFSTINIISVSVKIYNFTLVFIKATCHTNPGAERNFAGYFKTHISKIL